MAKRRDGLHHQHGELEVVPEGDVTGAGRPVLVHDRIGEAVVGRRAVHGIVVEACKQRAQPASHIRAEGVGRRQVVVELDESLNRMHVGIGLFALVGRGEVVAAVLGIPEIGIEVVVGVDGQIQGVGVAGDGVVDRSRVHAEGIAVHNEALLAAVARVAAIAVCHQTEAVGGIAPHLGEELVAHARARPILGRSRGIAREELRRLGRGPDQPRLERDELVAVLLQGPGSAPVLDETTVAAVMGGRVVGREEVILQRRHEGIEKGLADGQRRGRLFDPLRLGGGRIRRVRILTAKRQGTHP